MPGILQVPFHFILVINPLGRYSYLHFIDYNTRH